MTGESVNRDIERRPLRRALIVNIVILAATLPSQLLLRHHVSELRVDLAWQTRIAIGFAPPLLLTVLLLATIFVSRVGTTRVRNAWEVVVVIVCGGVLGQHALAICLAFAGGPVELSHRVVEIVRNVQGV